MVINQSNGECIIDTGGYIFNTEAHPIDPAALRCCYDNLREDLISDQFTPIQYLGESFQLKNFDETDPDEMQINDDIESDDIENNLKLDNVSDWLDSDEGRNELLKFLDSMKSLSEKKKKSFPIISNTSEIFIQNISISYDDKDNYISNISEMNVSDRNNSFSNSNNLTKSEIITDDTISKSTETKPDWKIILQQSEKLVAEKPTPKTDEDDDDEDDDDDDDNHISDQQFFDVQLLIENVRRMYNDSSIYRDYELLSCRSQAFIQRLAVFGEILT